MKKERIIIVLVTILTTSIIGSIILIPMISRMNKTNIEVSQTEKETKKKDGYLPSFALNKKNKKETKEETIEEKKTIKKKETETERVEESVEIVEETPETIPEPLVPESSTETSAEYIPPSTSPSVVETTPIPETEPVPPSSPSPSETKSQVFLGEDMDIVNSGIERNYQMSAIKEEIKTLMTNDIPEEVAQRVYDLAAEGQSLAIANIDTFSYLIGADTQGKFSYMDDEARTLNITCFKQDIEMYKSDYAEFQTYMDWASVFLERQQTN